MGNDKIVNSNQLFFFITDVGGNQARKWPPLATFSSLVQCFWARAQTLRHRVGDE
jgi:hypothetical protein